MNLQEIRRKTAYEPNAKPNLRAATRIWVASMSKDFPIALTLTLKQTIVEESAFGKRRHAITQADCAAIAKRFQQKLNRVVFGKYAADQLNMSLKFLPVVEGVRSGKRLHLHYAIGGLPNFVKFNEVDALITLAKRQVKHIDEQHKVDLTDSGWLEYITKEVSNKDSDNILWTLT